MSTEIARPIDIPEYDKTQGEVVALAARARAHRISDDISRAAAADIRAMLKKTAAVLEEARTSLVKPLNDHVRMINGKFKPLTDALDASVRVLDIEITRDRREREAAAEAARREQERLLEEERRKAEEEQRARAAAIATSTEKVALDVGMTASEAQELGQLTAQDELDKPVIVAVPPAPAPPPPKTIVGTTGATVTTRSILDFEVTDLAALAAALPDAIEVQRGKVLEYGRCQERGGQAPTLPGVRFFKRDSVAG